MEEPIAVRRLRHLAYLGVHIEGWGGTDGEGWAEWQQPRCLGSSAWERVFSYWCGDHVTQVHRRHFVTDSEWKIVKRTAVRDTQRKGTAMSRLSRVRYPDPIAAHNELINGGI